MNINKFVQQVETMYNHVNALYTNVNECSLSQTELIPIACKELGTATEELQVAVEHLYEQNELLTYTRAALEAECTRYQNFFEFAPDGYLVTDTDGVILEANQAAVKLLNVSQNFLVGKPLAVFVIPENRSFFRSEVTRLKGNKRLFMEIALQQRNGRNFDAAVTVATITDAAAKSVLLWLLRDIRDRHSTSLAAPNQKFTLPENRSVYFYTKGEVISLKPQTIWQVCQGLVKLSTLSDRGEEVILGFVGPGMPFSASSTSLKVYEAKAISDVELICFSEAEIETYPHLAQNLLFHQNQRLQQVESLLAVFGQRRVKDRLLHLLQLLKTEIGEPVETGTRLSVRLTHEDLANACGTTRVTITRLLSKLQKQGEIFFDANRHIILQAENDL